MLADDEGEVLVCEGMVGPVPHKVQFLTFLSKHPYALNTYIAVKNRHQCLLLSQMVGHWLLWKTDTSACSYQTEMVVYLVIVKNRHQSHHSSGAVWELRWLSWAVCPNELYGFHRCKAILNCAHALVSACPWYVNRHLRTLSIAWRKDRHQCMPLPNKDGGVLGYCEKQMSVLAVI